MGAHGKVIGIAESIPPYEEYSCANHRGVPLKRSTILGVLGTPFLDLMTGICASMGFKLDFILVCSNFFFPTFDGGRCEEGGKGSIDKANAPPSPRDSYPTWLYWLSTHAWLVYPLLKTWFGAEMRYNLYSLKAAADPHLWSLSHWITWGITGAYLAAEVGMKYLKVPEQRAENMSSVQGSPG